MIEVWPLIAFLFTEPEPDEKAWRKVMKPAVAPALAQSRDVIAATEPYDAATLETDLRELIEREELSASKALQPIRVAISGSTISPGIFESLEVLGRERSLERIDAALKRLSEGEDPDQASGSRPAG